MSKARHELEIYMQEVIWYLLDNFKYDIEYKLDFYKFFPKIILFIQENNEYSIVNIF